MGVCLHCWHGYYSLAVEPPSKKLQGKILPATFLLCFECHPILSTWKINNTMEEGQESSHSASKQLHAVIQIQALCRKLRKLKTLFKGYFFHNKKLNNFKEVKGKLRIVKQCSLPTEKNTRKKSELEKK